MKWFAGFGFRFIKAVLHNPICHSTLALAGGGTSQGKLQWPVPSPATATKGKRQFGMQPFYITQYVIQLRRLTIGPNLKLFFTIILRK